MNNLSIETSGNEMIIRINRLGFDEKYLVALIRRLQLESLAKDFGFTKDILPIAEEIDQKWWTENRNFFLKD